MKGPCIIAGELSEAELQAWLHKKAAQSGGLDSLRLDVLKFENDVSPQIAIFASKLRARISGLTSTEVCRTEESARLCVCSS